MPKSAYYTLTWSSSHQAYELYEGQGDDALDLIPDSLAWLVWVSQVSSFAFHGQHGSCTVRKERKRRGGEYWYAYARVEGNLSKRYLGRDSDLTLRRLEQVAQAFWLDGQVVAPQKQAGASAQARPASPTRLGESVVLGYLSGAQARSSDGNQGSRVRLEPLSAAAQQPAGGESSLGGRKTDHERGDDGRKGERSAVIAGWPTDPLLATKLHAPRPRPHLVHRPRLLQRLQQGREGALTVLSAPAGFGKSTLLGDG